MVYVSVRSPGQDRGRTLERSRSLEAAREFIDSYDFSSYPDDTLIRLAYRSGKAGNVEGWYGSILYEQYEVQGGVLIPTEGRSHKRGKTRSPESFGRGTSEFVGIDPGIDEEIRPLLVALNRAGYVTKFSCAGHESAGVGGIAFKRTKYGGGSFESWTTEEVIDVTSMAERFGIEDLDFSIGPLGKQILFKPVGSQSKGTIV